MTTSISCVRVYLFKGMVASDYNRESMTCTKLHAKPGGMGTYLILTSTSRPAPAGLNPIPSASDMARCLRRNLSPCLTRATEDAVQGPAGALALGCEGIGD